MTDVVEPAVIVGASKGVGRLTLNRPRAINALDHGMIGELAAALDAWENEPEIRVVLLDGAGDRGLCAGGDVRGLAAQVAAGGVEEAAVFFRAEYALNARIAEYPKPFVVLADGITMGGGIGLAGHAAIRIVTERSRLAMPETRIGFTPDVGGTWLLARAPGRLGEYLGLTGETMDAADAIYAGFADHLVPVARLGELVESLALWPAQPTGALNLPESEAPAPSRLEAAREWVDDAFAADTVAEIVERLRARAAGGARALSERQRDEASVTADLLGRLSPTGLAVTLASIRRSRELEGLRDALAQEYGLVLWFAATQPDFPEGIRAQLIDKDRAPRWRPATIAELAPDIAATAFAYEPATPLWS